MLMAQMSQSIQSGTPMPQASSEVEGCGKVELSELPPHAPSTAAAYVLLILS
jgi:hypothetical protein